LLGVKYPPPTFLFISGEHGSVFCYVCGVHHTPQDLLKAMQRCAKSTDDDDDGNEERDKIF
jgi:hypothetical protein